MDPVFQGMLCTYVWQFMFCFLKSVQLVFPSCLQLYSELILVEHS